MPTCKTTRDSTPGNVVEDPDELDAKADEHEAEGYRHFASAKELHAQARRARRAQAAMPAVRSSSPMKQSEYAERENVCKATVTRWIAEGMPVKPVGSTVRIDPMAADAWRGARGRKPTKAASPREREADVDIDLARSGLRIVGGAR